MKPRRKSPETQIRLDIKRLLRMRDFAVYDMEQNRPTRQTAGFPDLVAFGHGRVLFIEVKTANGRLSDAQEEFRFHVLPVEQQKKLEYHLWRSAKDAWEYLARERIVREAGG